MCFPLSCHGHGFEVRWHFLLTSPRSEPSARQLLRAGGARPGATPCGLQCGRVLRRCDEGDWEKPANPHGFDVDGVEESF